MQDNNQNHMQNAEPQKNSTQKVFGIAGLALVLAIAGYFASRQGLLFRADLSTVPSQNPSNTSNTLYIPNNYQSESPNASPQTVSVLVGDSKLQGGILAIQATFTYLKSEFDFVDGDFVVLGPKLLAKQLLVDQTVTTVDATTNKLTINIGLNNTVALNSGDLAFQLKFTVPGSMTPPKTIGLVKGTLVIKNGSNQAIASVTGIEAANIIAIACASGSHWSGSACEANNSVTMCGVSATDCTVGLTPNATATCDGTSCGFTCNNGFHKTGSTCTANSAIASCGVSATNCTSGLTPNATATCDGSSCGFTCNAGFHKTGPTCTSDGNVSSCGTSGANCNAGLPANATATCSGNPLVCGFNCNTGYTGATCATCAIGYQDNDGNGTCSQNCASSNLVCNANGACSDSNGTAACKCNPGFEGNGTTTCTATASLANCPTAAFLGAVHPKAHSNVLLRGVNTSVFAWKLDGQDKTANTDGSVALSNLSVGSHTATLNGIACTFTVDCYTSIDTANARKAIGSTDPVKLLLYDYDGNGAIEVADKVAIFNASKSCN